MTITKKTTTKKSARTGSTAPHDNPDLDLALDAIAKAHPKGWDALNLYTILHNMPRFLRDAIHDATGRATDQLDIANPFAETDPARAFEMLVNVCEATGDTFTLPPARLIQYPPDIEARRADYEALAEMLIGMIDLSTGRVRQTLDVEPRGSIQNEPPADILIDAIHRHTGALFENINESLTYQARFLRTLYIELRLYYDHEMKSAEREREATDDDAPTETE